MGNTPFESTGPPPASAWVTPIFELRRPAPFSLCLNCGEFYTAREREFTKLATLSSEARTGSDLALWTLYSLQWAPVSVGRDGDNPCLVLRDEEPYDYALAERLFPAAAVKEIRFRVKPVAVAQGHALEIEVQDQKGGRPIRLRLDKDWLGFDHKKASVPEPVRVRPGAWHDIALQIDCRAGKYRIGVNGNWLQEEATLAEKVETVESLVFRTGPPRVHVPAEWVDGEYQTTGIDAEDLPGADTKAPLCLYYLDDVSTR